MINNFSSEKFINLLIAGDKDATTLIVRSYTSHLVKASLGMGISHEASEDLAHSTWETFFKVINRFEKRSHIRTFLFGIFYNKVSEYKRVRIKTEKCDPIDDVVEDRFATDGHYRGHQVGPEQYVDSQETLEIINNCLENLPLTQRLVFTMKSVNEEDNSFICNTLDISPTNLRQLLFRAKNRLKTCVDLQIKKGSDT